MNFKATGDMVIVPLAEYKALVNRLEVERDFHEGVSDIEEGAEAWVRQATISTLEKEDGSAPRLDNARRIAEVLRCELDYLF